MSRTLAVVLGFAAGTVALVGTIAFLTYFCLCRNRNALSTSETGSSDPSIQGKLQNITYGRGSLYL